MRIDFHGSDGPIEFLATGTSRTGIVWVPAHAVVTDRTGVLTELTREDAPSASHPETGLNCYRVPRWKWDERVGQTA